MQNRDHILIFILLLFAITIAACQPAPTPTKVPDTPTAVYPEPTIDIPTANPAVYPGPGGTSQASPLSWDDAKAKILNGEVQSISLNQNSLDFFMTLKTGLVVSSVQPSNGAVLDVITQCGDKCKDIQH
jgi:hypothetical protein